jgi:FlaA1/EpsC-like NDP-sugar epimerase
MNSRFKTLKLLLSMMLDSAIIYGVYLLAFYIREKVRLPFTLDLLPESRFEVVKHHYFLMIAMHLVVLYFFGIYERVWKKYFWDTVKYLFVPSIIGTLLLISVYFFRGDVYFPRSIFIVFPLLTIVSLNFWRNIAARLRKTGVKQIIVVGINPDSLNLFSTFKEHFRDRINVVGVIAFSKAEIESNKDELDSLGVEVLGEISEIKRVLKGKRYDEII